MVLSAHQDRVRVTQGDALNILEQTPFSPGTVIFVDPPYTAGAKSAGKRLYTHHALDHERLFRACAGLRVPWLMTHEHDPNVMALAWQNGLSWRSVKMVSGHNVTARELVVGRDFRWAEGLGSLLLPGTVTQPSLFGPDNNLEQVETTAEYPPQ